MAVFSKFLNIDCPASLDCEKTGKNPEFRIDFSADGEIPFAQVILHGQGKQKIIRAEAAPAAEGEWHYTATVPAGLFEGCELTVQVEGCRLADLGRAGGDDWIKAFRPLRDSEFQRLADLDRLRGDPPMDAAAEAGGQVESES